MGYNTAMGSTGQPNLGAGGEANFYFEMDTTAFVKMLNRFQTELASPAAAPPVMLVAYALLLKIIQKTPVWTGETRGNWFKSQDILAGKMGGSFAKAPSPASVAEAFGYRKGRCEFRTAGLYKEVAMINKAPHATLVEYGWSTKAPWGMVRISVQEMYGIIPPVVLAQLKYMWASGGVSPGTSWWGGTNGPNVTAYRYQIPTVLRYIIHKNTSAGLSVGVGIGG